jgi:hypothetical protein
MKTDFSNQLVIENTCIIKNGTYSSVQMLKNSYSSVAAVPYLKTVRCWLLTMEAKV